jgi:polyphosphate:AMP phosphotransferase
LFEVAEVGRKVSKAIYQRRQPELRVELLKAQYELRQADFPVIVLLAGDNRAGCNDMLNVLHEWLDTRLIDTNAMDAPSDEERERPEFWRYWRSLPSTGRIAVYLGAWTMRAIRDRLGKRISKVDFERAVERIVRFERALADDGALVLKFWLHIPKKELERHLKLAAKRPDKAWWVQEVDYRIYKNYDRAMKTVERALRKTSTAEAPWNIVESTDARHRDLTVAGTLLKALSARLSEEAAAPMESARVEAAPRAADPHSILDTVDLSLKLDRETYDRRLKRRLAAVNNLTQQAREVQLSSVLVFEGWDAAGKGSCIRRLTRAMDAQNYRVVQVAAPTEEERARHYLWRFWRQLPRAGKVIIFDRSWYGRVLVERVEGLATEHEWRRAYSEINELEEQLWECGMPLLKFWLQLDAEEQLRRFREREKTPFKTYKITEEDYRNRQRRSDYETAANEMIARTSSEFAPWHLVPANDKRWARIQVLETFAKALKAGLAEA